MIETTEDSPYLEEYLKCRKDPIYFINNYIKVIHPVRGLVPFKLYPFQKKIINDIETHRFNILRKFRQAGCTTIAGAYALWMIVFQKYQTIGVLSKGDLEATELLDRIKIMYDELPPWMQPAIIEKNKHTFKLETQSVIKTRASGKNAGRGFSGSLLIIDEAAFIEHIDTIWAAAYPIISTGGRVFALSTVNGVGNWFHKMYNGAVNKTNTFNAVDIRWQDHPEYKRQEGEEFKELYEEMARKNLNPDSWEETTKSNISIKQWLQEYECAFQGTGDTYIDGEVLQEVTSNTSENYISEDRGRLRIWHQPEPQYQYIIGADVALGRGRDYSAFHVINLYNGQQVAEYYCNRVPVNEFAEVLNRIGLKYNLAYLVVERNNIGSNVIDYLYNQYQYENLWMDEKGEFGFLTTQKSKDSILANLEDHIRTSKIKINSIRTCDELSTFIINDNGKVEPDEGYTDDLIMSLAISAYAYKDIRGSTPLEFSTESKNMKNIEYPLPTRINNKGTFGVTLEDDLGWFN